MRTFIYSLLFAGLIVISGLSSCSDSNVTHTSNAEDPTIKLVKRESVGKCITTKLIPINRGYGKVTEIHTEKAALYFEGWFAYLPLGVEYYIITMSDGSIHFSWEGNQLQYKIR